MQQYQWAVKVTTIIRDGQGNFLDANVEFRDADTQAQARARYEALMHYLLDPKRPVAKRHRITSAELVRRPVGDWEGVESTEGAYDPVVDDEEVGQRIDAAAAEGWAAKEARRA